MRVVLDTNVFISGVFFSGPPRRILEAWRDGKLSVAFSVEILEEYQRVGDRLGEKYPSVDLRPFLQLLGVEGKLVDAGELDERVSPDSDDDKFLACALAAGSKLVISGDSDVLEVSGWKGVKVVTPAEFVSQYLG